MPKPIGIGVDATEVVKVLKTMGSAEKTQQVNQAVRVFGNDILAKLHQNITRFMPVLTGGTEELTQIEPVQIVRAKGPLVEWGGRVVNDEPQAPVIERGRKAGANGPPIKPIRRWLELMVQHGKIDLEGVRQRPVIPGARRVRGRQARKRLRPSQQEEAIFDRVAWAVRNKIHRKGIRPKRPFRKGAKRTRRFIQRATPILGTRIAKLLVTP